MSSQSTKTRSPLISVKDVSIHFGSHIVLDHLDLSVFDQEILGFVGQSGGGKSVLLRSILGLLPVTSGNINIFGQKYSSLSDKKKQKLGQRLGVLFQQGALFSSLTVLENIQVPMREYMNLRKTFMDELAYLKMHQVGLTFEAAHKLPSELSGGMIKRAALARALALDPDILFLDEPTSGLDPVGADEFDQLLLELRESLGLTVYMVTHDLDSLNKICDRIVLMGQGKIVASGTMEEMIANSHPLVQSYFMGNRARNIIKQEER